MGSQRVRHDWATFTHLLLGRKATTNLDSILKSRDITLPTKVCLVRPIGEGSGTPLQCSCLENPRDGGAWWATVYGVEQSRTRLKRLSSSSSSSQSYGFSSGHVWMWELDHKESWVPKNWCFWTVVLQKTLENPLDCKEIQPVNPKGNQPWIFIGRTNAEAEALILWPPDMKNLIIGKDPHDGKDWGQENKEVTEDETVGWHHWLNGHESANTERWWRTGKPGML